MYKVFMLVFNDIALYWNVVAYNLVVCYKYFGRVYCLHLKGRSITL